MKLSLQVVVVPERVNHSKTRKRGRRGTWNGGRSAHAKLPPLGGTSLISSTVQLTIDGSLEEQERDACVSRAGDRSRHLCERALTDHDRRLSLWQVIPTERQTLLPTMADLKHPLHPCP